MFRNKTSPKITLVWGDPGPRFLDTHCEVCSGPIVQPRTGRRRKTCTPACRKALYRRRHSHHKAQRQIWNKEARQAETQLRRWERRYGPIDDTPMASGYGLRTYIGHWLRRGQPVYQCWVCGKPINLYHHPRSLGRRYCSSRCAHKVSLRASRLRKVLYVYWGPRRYYAHDFKLWRRGYIVTVCDHCHCAFVPHINTRNPAKYCSKSCRQAAYYKRKRRRVIGWRVCPSCSKRFGARFHTQRYCDPKCGAKYVARLWRASKLKTPQRSACVVCAGPLPPDPSNGGPRRKYCSPKCQDVVRRRNLKHRRETANIRRCNWCGTPLDWRTYGLIRYCSDSCRRLMSLDNAARYRRNKAERISTITPETVSQNAKSP